jgi:hypothetical protein
LSRILEFQPMDEQTVVSRVLIELHQAIDLHFPDANPGGRQFTKTVLTNQSDSTRVDNAPAKPASVPRSQNPKLQVSPPKGAALQGSFADMAHQELSLTPKTGIRNAFNQELLKTADVRQLIGESRGSQILRFALLILLLIGISICAWFVVIGTDF